jgi:hypothetical protein
MRRIANLLKIFKPKEHSMSEAEPTIPELENQFYFKYLKTAIEFYDDKVEGIKFRALTASAGVVAKQRQTRGAMTALSYQMARDRGKGLIPLDFIPEQE